MCWKLARIQNFFCQTLIFLKISGKIQVSLVYYLIKKFFRISQYDIKSITYFKRVRNNRKHWITKPLLGFQNLIKKLNLFMLSDYRNKPSNKSKLCS